MVGDDEGAEHVLRDDPPGISDHICIARLQTEYLVDLHTGIHAGDDRQFPARLPRQRSVLEPPGVRLVRLKIVGALSCRFGLRRRSLGLAWNDGPLTDRDLSV